jgi:uncharacterized protein (TIRG00374 family)
LNLRRLFHNPYIRLAAWTAALGVMLYLALRNVNLADVWGALGQADLRFVGLALFSVAVNIWAKTARWQVLIGPRNGIGFGKLLIALITGQTLNLFLPGRVGELSRAYVIGGLGPGRIFILGTVAIEKVLDMVSYALVFLLLVLLLPLPGWINDSGFTFTAVAGLVLLGVVILAANPGAFAQTLERLTVWLPERVRVQVVGRFHDGLESLKVMRQRSDLLKVALLSVLAWASAIWTNQLALQALHLELPWTAAGVLLVVLQAGITVPSIPGRVGLFQYLCILSLALFGVGETAGLSYGILLQAIVFLPPTILSLAFLPSMGWGIGARSIESRE